MHLWSHECPHPDIKPRLRHYDIKKTQKWGETCEHRKKCKHSTPKVTFRPKIQMWKHKIISMTHLSLHGSWILILHMLFWLLYCLHFKRPVHFRHLGLPSDESLHVKIAWLRSLLFALVCEQSSSNSCLTLELLSAWVSIRRSGKVIWESLFLEWETERFSAINHLFYIRS